MLCAPSHPILTSDRGRELYEPFRTDDHGRPVVLTAWIECESCGRIERPTHDFNYPADMAEEMELFVRIPCEQCGRLAKLHMRRELKPLQ